MGVIHIEMYGFKPLATPEEVQGVCDRMLSLKDDCIHPVTQKPYIRTSLGGTNTSPQQTDDGITHVLVCEFDSPEDRRYYLEEDPAYGAFVASIDGIVEKTRVVDFCPGEFASRTF